MPLPPSCQIVEGALVFRELAHPATLADADAVFAHVCEVACTNGFRPLAHHQVELYAFPDLEPDGAAQWGGGEFGAADADRFRAEGYVLAEIRLPAQPMGLPLPAGSMTQRPTSSGSAGTSTWRA